MPSKLSKGLTLLKAKIDEYNAKHRTKVLEQWNIAPEHQPEFIAEGKLQDRRARELPGPDKKPNLPGGKVSGTYPEEADIEKAKVDQIAHGRTGKMGPDHWSRAAQGKQLLRQRRAADAFHPHYDVLEDSPGHEGMLTEHSEDRLWALQNQNKSKPKLPGGHSRAHPDYIGTNVEKAKIDDVRADVIRANAPGHYPKEVVEGEIARHKMNARSSRHMRIGGDVEGIFEGDPSRNPVGGIVDPLRWRVHSAVNRPGMGPTPKLPKGHDRSHPDYIGTNVEKAKIDDVRHGRSGDSGHDDRLSIESENKRRDRFERRLENRDFYTRRMPGTLTGEPRAIGWQTMRLEQTREMSKPKLPKGRVSGTYPEEADVKKTGPTKRENKQRKLSWEDEEARLWDVPEDYELEAIRDQRHGRRYPDELSGPRWPNAAGGPGRRRITGPSKKGLKAMGKHPSKDVKFGVPADDLVEKVNYRSKGKAEGKASKPGTKYDSKARDVLSDIKANVSTGQVRPTGERSRRSSGAPLKPEGSMYAIGEKRPEHSAGVKDRTILSYGGHWPVVTHYHDKKLLVLNAHPYSGPTKLVTKTLLHEVPKKFPGHKIIQVAAHSHHEISRVMKGNLHDLHEHLGRMADHHEDKVLSLAAKHEPEHSNEDVKKLVSHHVGEVKRYRADRDHLGKILYGKSK